MEEEVWSDGSHTVTEKSDEEVLQEPTLEIRLPESESGKASDYERELQLSNEVVLDSKTRKKRKKKKQKKNKED